MTAAVDCFVAIAPWLLGASGVTCLSVLVAACLRARRRPEPERAEAHCPCGWHGAYRTDRDAAEAYNAHVLRELERIS